MRNKILIFLTIFLSGCSTYKSSLDVNVSGDGIRYGLYSVKKGEITVQKRRDARTQDKYKDKYLTCMEELLMCEKQSQEMD